IMTPAETVQSIENSKRLVHNIADDKAMSTVFSASFDLLKNLCRKDITAQNFAYDLELMELQRKLSLKHDSSKVFIRNEPMRKLVYALSESIQRTAQVLISKTSVVPESIFSVEAITSSCDAPEDHDVTVKSTMGHQLPIPFMNGQSSAKKAQEKRIVMSKPETSDTGLIKPSCMSTQSPVTPTWVDKEMPQELKEEPFEDQPVAKV
ncbi:hypothetical protein PENTCL1PPCAC_4321, partial [Pristionchus entomophagus]